MSLTDKTLGVNPADVWGYATRTLTGFPFPEVTLGKLRLRNFKGAKYGEGSVAAGATADIRPPAGENWLLIVVSASATTMLFKVCDGTNMDGVGLLAGGTAPVSVTIPISNSLFIRVNNTGVASGSYSYLAFVLPTGVSVLGAVPSVAADTTVEILKQVADRYRLLCGAVAIGDGTNAGYVRLYNIGFNAYTELASGTGSVRWNGAREDFYSAQIRNESASAIYLGWLGLEMPIP